MLALIVRGWRYMHHQSVDQIAIWSTMLLLAAVTMSEWFRSPVRGHLFELSITAAAVAFGCCKKDGMLKLATCRAGTPFLLMGVWATLQLAVSSSVYPYATQVEIQHWLMLANVASISCLAIDVRSNLNQLLHFVAAFGGGLALLDLSQQFTSHGAVFWSIPTGYTDVYATFISRNGYCAFMELCFPVALYLVDTGKREYWWLWLASSSLMFSSVVASGSRAGAVLIVCELAVIIALQLRRHGAGQFRRLSLVAVVLTLTTLGAGWGNLRSRFSEVSVTHGRTDLFRSTGCLISRRPLLGSGLGTFERAYPQCATGDFGATVDHAHNDWLEWISEGGVGGAAFILCLVIFGILPALKMGWSMGVVFVSLHAFVDYPFHRLEVAAWTAMFIGAAASAAAAFPLRDRSVFVTSFWPMPHSTSVRCTSSGPGLHW